MTAQQIVAIATSFLIIIVITTLAMLRWLPSGLFKTVLVFASGVGVIVALRVAGIPPWWFDGSKSAFGITVSLALWGFLSMSNADERTFGRPLLFGMALTLTVLNVVAFFVRHV